MRSIQRCGVVQLRKSRPFTPTDRPLPAKWRVKEQVSNPTASERSAKSRPLMRTKFKLAKICRVSSKLKNAVESVQNSMLSSQFKTQEDAVESVQNSRRCCRVSSKLEKMLSSQFKTQEDAVKMKKCVESHQNSRREEYTSKLKWRRARQTRLTGSDWV